MLGCVSIAGAAVIDAGLGEDVGAGVDVGARAGRRTGTAGAAGCELDADLMRARISYAVAPIAVLATQASVTAAAQRVRIGARFGVDVDLDVDVWRVVSDARARATARSRTAAGTVGGQRS